MALETSSKKKKAGAGNDIFTALLGLALLALAGTTGYVCLRGLEWYDTIFRIL